MQIDHDLKNPHTCEGMGSAFRQQSDQSKAATPILVRDTRWAISRDLITGGQILLRFGHTASIFGLGFEERLLVARNKSVLGESTVICGFSRC
jgi:hypothetical protein